MAATLGGARTRPCSAWAAAPTPAPGESGLRLRLGPPSERSLTSRPRLPRRQPLPAPGHPRGHPLPRAGPCDVEGSKRAPALCSLMTYRRRWAGCVHCQTRKGDRNRTNLLKHGLHRTRHGFCPCKSHLEGDRSVGPQCWVAWCPAAGVGTGASSFLQTAHGSPRPVTGPHQGGTWLSRASRAGGGAGGRGGGWPNPRAELIGSVRTDPSWPQG